MTIQAILDSLAATTKKTEKISILKEHKDNGLLKRVFMYALDPFYVFYIKKIPTVSKGSSKLPIDGTPTHMALDDALDNLSPLLDRTVTGNAAIEHVSELLRNLSENDAKTLATVLKKDLRCGVSVKTVNKVWPGLVFDYPVMLGKKIDDKAMETFEFPCFAQTKFDGMRVNAIVYLDSNKVEYYSRNGKPVDANNGALDADCIEIAFGIDTESDVVVLDGELISKDYSTGEYLSRKLSNGICNKAIRGTISARERAMLHICVWDWIPMEKFEEGYFNLPYKDRLQVLWIGISNRPNSGCVSLVDTRVVENSDEAVEFGKERIQQGEEGAILKTQNGPWENRRSPHMIKIKDIKTIDARVIGYEKGEGKREGLIGSLVCETADGIQFHAGSGFSDEDLEKSPDFYMDKIVEVEYNEVIDRKTDGRKTLFLPIFKGIRLDKNEPDVLLK